MIKSYKVTHTNVVKEQKTYYDLIGYGMDNADLKGLTKEDLHSLKIEIEGILAEEMPEPPQEKQDKLFEYVLKNPNSETMKKILDIAQKYGRPMD